MNFFDSLIEKYGRNEPIFLTDISYENYSKPWIMKKIKALCESGELIRYEKGIYYIPTNTVFGKSILNPYKVIEKKYIKDDKNTFGYYSGLTLQNRLKMSTQNPNINEIYTNNDTTNIRNVVVGGQKVMLRKARTAINNSNSAVLSFLELMNDITPRSLDEDKKGRIIDYIRQNDIRKNDIITYASVFPDRVMRNLIESEAIFSVAQ